MIRKHYSSKATNASYASTIEDDENLFSEDKDNNFTAVVERGKRKSVERKCVESDVHLQLCKLEALGLDSDEEDEDVLLIDAEDTDLGEETSLAVAKTEPSKTVRQVRIIEDDDGVILNGHTSPPPNSMVDEKDCQMKWLRTVGMDHTGNLMCVVSGVGVDTASESGRSGKTESLMADTIKGMIDVYQKKRAEVVDKDGVIATPLHIVKSLASKHGETLHCEAVTFPIGFHRVELFCGTMRGIGEGSTKRLAAQMAAIDMMDHIQLSGGTVKVPPAAFLPGWLTSNRVFRDLREFCKKLGLEPPKITSQVNTREDGTVDPNVPKFKAQCWVGDKYMTVGESEVDVFARREAAKEMFFILTNEEYKDTPYAIGRACKRMDELTGAGFQLAMSDYKRVWLLQNRVKDNKLMIPEEERGIDEPFDLEELQKEICHLDDISLQMMTKKRDLKVRVSKKIKIDGEDKSGTSVVRKVMLQPKIDEDEEVEEW